MEPIEIYRQDRIRGKLERDIASDRLSPSIIFHGLPGLGKERMAFYLAQLILCQGEERRACGECLPCRKVIRLSHPDVQWSFPRPGSMDDEELEKVIGLKASESFYRPTFAKTTSHAIDEIRRLRTVSGKKPYEGSHKVFIVTEADRMTVEAANAFLKLLEEPPDDTVIVMTTSRLYALLPTIRSRCEEIRFSPVPLGDLLEVLETELGLSLESADRLARHSEGSVGRAVWLDREGEEGGWRDAWELLQLAQLGTEADRLEYVFRNPMKGDRDRIGAAFETLVSALRDLIAINLDLGQGDLINASRYDLLSTFEEVPVDGTIRSMRFIGELRQLLDRNVNASALIWRLLHNLSVSLKGGMTG